MRCISLCLLICGLACERIPQEAHTGHRGLGSPDGDIPFEQSTRRVCFGRDGTRIEDAIGIWKHYPRSRVVEVR